MIQSLVALGNCLKSGSNRGAGTEWDCAFVAIGCTTSNGGAGILTETSGKVMIMYNTSRVRVIPIANVSELLATIPGISFGHHCSVPRAFVSMPLDEEIV